MYSTLSYRINLWPVPSPTVANHKSEPRGGPRVSLFLATANDVSRRRKAVYMYFESWFGVVVDVSDPARRRRSWPTRVPIFGGYGRGLGCGHAVSIAERSQATAASHGPIHCAPDFAFEHPAPPPRPLRMVRSLTAVTFLSPHCLGPPTRRPMGTARGL